MSLPDSVCLVTYHRPHYKLYTLLFCAIYRWYLLAAADTSEHAIKSLRNSLLERRDDAGQYLSRRNVTNPGTTIP